MTRPRRQRARTESSDVVAALRTGAAAEYTPESHDRLIGIYYFGDLGELTVAEKNRARELLDEWRDQQHAHERRRREIGE